MPSGPDYGAHYPSASDSSPRCPRHPDRVAYVRCQRCDNPVCPECQRPSAVGVKCVDCANAEARAVPREHRPGKFVDSHGQPIPVITYALIALCVVVYAAQWISRMVPGDVDVTNALSYAGLDTSQLGLQMGETVGLGFEPWRMLTSAFVHSMGSPLHLIMNMVVLWMIGRVLEPALGRWRFLAIYLLSALGGSVAVLWLSDPRVPVVGASGAVYGLFAALFIVLRTVKANTTSIVALIVVNLVISFTISGVSWQGHIGGLVTGALSAGAVAWAMKPPKGQVSTPEQRKKANRNAWLGMAGVAVLLIVLAVAGGAQITVDSVLKS